jgi:hypothetical protein
MHEPMRSDELNRFALPYMMHRDPAIVKAQGQTVLLHQRDCLTHFVGWQAEGANHGDHQNASS